MTGVQTCALPIFFEAHGYSYELIFVHDCGPDNSWGVIRELRQELHADPVLGALHMEAVAWRQARFLALMQEDVWRSLFGQLLMAGPTRVLPRAEAESIWRPYLKASPGKDGS